MPLARGYRPEQVEIKVRGEALGSFRGLNATDLMVLVRDNLMPMRDAIRAMSPNGQVDRILHGQTYADLALAAMSADPHLICRIIAMCADEEDLDEAQALVEKYSFSAQMLILSEIVRLTLEDAGGPLGLLTLIAKATGLASPETASLINSWSAKIRSALNERLRGGQDLFNGTTTPSLASTETHGTA